MTNNQSGENQHPNLRQEMLNNLTVGGNLTIGNVTQLYGAVESAQHVNISGNLPLSDTANLVDNLVQQVRARIYDDIQSLHGTMPLWGIDHWVPLGDLFVDVNILESLSSSSRSELDDLWQDFTTGDSNYRSLDRIGLGRKQRRVSGLAVLEKNTNLMVVGKPGSGKTTYLQRIVTECNVGKLQTQRIPVLIKVRYFVDDGRQFGYNLEQFLGQLWQLSNTNVQLLLNQGRALVLLDGLDEVTGEAGKQIAKEIKQFTRAYPQVQIVVTCRTQTLSDLFDWQSLRFTCIEVASFEEEQVRAFATHWFKTVCGNMGEKQAREFLEQLFREENKPIKELATTPILLSLTCLVFQGKEKFYSKRSELYEEGLELLLEMWDKSRSVERDEIYRDLSVERKLELLSYIAVKKFEQEKYVLFEQEELEGYIGEFLEIEQRDSRGVLQAIESQHGLLIKRSNKVWSFSHLTFQEYLVAKWFVEPKNHIQLAIHVTEKHWREVFLLIFQLLSDASQLILAIKITVDNFLANNIELQNFLQWIYENTTESSISHKPSAIRAFYLQPGLASIHNHNIAYALDPEFSSKVKPGLYQNMIYVFDKNCKIILLFNNHYNYFLLVDDIRQSFAKCEFELLEESIKYLYFSDETIEPVPELQFYRQIWLEKLRMFVIKHYSMGYSWQFSESQKYLLQQYYDANRLIVNSLNSNCIVSNTVRQEIEEQLFLPIAGIKKSSAKKVSNS